MSRWKKETSGDVNGLHISTALSASCPALPGLHMASPHLRALHKAALALHCIALLCLALLCLALPCFAYAFPGPHTAAARPADTTRRAARMDARRFCKGHGCPLQKFLPDLRTRSAEGAQGARTGCAFFLVTFSLHKQRKSNSRPKGVKALLSAQLSRTIPKKRERSALNFPPKKKRASTDHATLQHRPAPYPHPLFGHLLPHKGGQCPGGRRDWAPDGTRETPGTGLNHAAHTFNNKNSRSHELMTRKNVSYSFRFTEM